jgi:hypothetical protein
MRATYDPEAHITVSEVKQLRASRVRDRRYEILDVSGPHLFGYDFEIREWKNFLAGGRISAGRTGTASGPVCGSPDRTSLKTSSSDALHTGGYRLSW